MDFRVDGDRKTLKVTTEDDLHIHYKKMVRAMDVQTKTIV